MASPRHLPAAAGSGNKADVIGRSIALDCKGGQSSSPSTNNKPAGFNLRKSIAWNPAFFTEQGVLDNSELSLLTGSQLTNANTSPGSQVAVSPFCRSGRSAPVRVLKEAAENFRGKLPAKNCSTEKQGRKLFSSVKTPQRNPRRESMETQNKASSRSIQKCVPRLPSGSIQKKVPNASPTDQMPGVPKKSQPSVPTAPPSTSSLTTIPKSNIKLGPVKAEQVHNSVSSGSGIAKDVVPTITAIRKEASGSVKCTTFLPHPQITPSRSFGGPASTFAKPSSLRMPSPSVGFFTQENAHVSHGNASKRNVGRCFAGNASSLVKPPRYKQPQDLKSRLDLTKPLSTNSTAASNLVLPVIRESNPDTLVAPEKESSSKFITTYSEKYGNANNQERSDVNCSLAGNEVTIQPPNPAKNDASRNSMPVVYSDTSHIERRGISKEIEPFENSYPLKVVYPSAIESVDSSLTSTCPLTKPIVGGTSLPSSISSRVCSSSDLTCQSKSESGSSEAIYLENPYVGGTTLAISLSGVEGCTPGLDFLQGFDPHDHQSTECTTLLKSTVCVDQAPCYGSSNGETPALADCNSDFGDSLCNEAKPASLEEPNTDGRMELETNIESAVKETPSHVGCEHNHNYRSTELSPMKLEAPTPCVERQHALPVESNVTDKMVLDSDKLSALEGSSQLENTKALDRLRTNTILKYHLENLVPFTEEWLAVMEARGQEVLEQKTGAVQNSPPDKTSPEPSPWSPVKRKAQDVGPFDCTKYSKSVRTSGTP